MDIIHTVAVYDMGNLDIACPHCNALHWACERLTSSSARRPVFGICCLSGKISVTLHRQPPEELKVLYSGTTPESKYFLQHIWNFNYAFAFTSLGVENASIQDNGPFCFKIQGRLHHQIGSFLPTLSAGHSFAQIYIINSKDDAIMQCMQNNPHLVQNNAIFTQSIMSTLHDIILCNNPLVQIYKSAFQLATNQSHIILWLCTDESQDNCQYNLPTDGEIAILLPGSENTTAQKGGILFCILMLK